jgi:hypothetical protein
VAIDNLPARPADAPAAPPAEAPVPEWLRPGAEIVKDADSTRSVGAAKTSGRVLGTAAGWLAAGTRGAGAAWWRYVRASDLIDSIEPRTPGEWDFIHGVRKKRWITCACTTGGGILGSLGAWIGTVAGMGMTALPGLEAAGTTEGALAAVATALYGRALTRRPAELTPGEQPAAIGPGEAADDGEPFPLAWCKDGDQVRTCIQRALAAEGIGTRSITVLGYRGWGWELALELKGATPGKVMAAADQIEGHLALPDGGFMPEPVSTDKSKVTVRLVETSPFADMPRPTAHAPRSLSVHDIVILGRAMDGGPSPPALTGSVPSSSARWGPGRALGRSARSMRRSPRAGMLWCGISTRSRAVLPSSGISWPAAPAPPRIASRPSKTRWRSSPPAAPSCTPWAWGTAGTPAKTTPTCTSTSTSSSSSAPRARSWRSRCCGRADSTACTSSWLVRKPLRMRSVTPSP